MAPKDKIQPETGISTGIQAFDDILAGGYVRSRVHLIEGRPGSGKTTLALQFLMAARERGENTLYVTLSEGKEELKASAATHGARRSQEDWTFPIQRPPTIRLEEAEGRRPRWPLSRDR